MSNIENQQQGDGQQVQGSAQKDPSDWATGDEPITASQLSYIQTMATEAGVEGEDYSQLTKAQASQKIEELQAATGREGGTGTESVG